jgi:hypothetical protein
MHLTYHDSDLHTATASTAKAEGAGEPGTEVEVTPAMIEAGVGAFYAYDNRYEPAEVVVLKIFCQMMARTSERERLVRLAPEVAASLSPYLPREEGIVSHS